MPADYDPRHLAHRRAPLDLLGPLREAAPIVHNPTIGGWMLLRFDDVQEALRDPRLSNARIQSYAAHLRQRGEDPGPIADSLAHWMVFNDPPRQMELRLMVAKTFGVRSMARLKASIEEIVQRLIDRLEPAGKADLIADFALSLTNAPTLAVAKLKMWQVNAWQRYADNFFALAADQLAIGHEASKLLFDFAPNDFAKPV